MVWDEIARRTALHDEPQLPAAPTMQTHIDHAQKMRDFLDRECTKTVCAVCSMMRRTCDITRYPIKHIPNVHLLDASGPKTDQFPRAALTVVEHVDVDNTTTYCMQPASVFEDEADVCIDCYTDLEKSRIPDLSLVAFDTGTIACSRYR